MAVAIDPLRRHLGLEPGRGDHGQGVERVAHRLADALQAVEGAGGGQHMGGVGALPATRLEQLAGDAMLQERVEQEMLRAPGHKAATELREDGVVEAVIGQLEAEQVRHVDAAAHGVGGLAIGQVLRELEDEHQGQAPGRLGGLAMRREQGGEALVRVEEAEVVAQAEPGVAGAEGGAGHAGGIRGDRADKLRTDHGKPPFLTPPL